VKKNIIILILFSIVISGCSDDQNNTLMDAHNILEMSAKFEGKTYIIQNELILLFNEDNNTYTNLISKQGMNMNSQKSQIDLGLKINSDILDRIKSEKALMNNSKKQWEKLRALQESGNANENRQLIEKIYTTLIEREKLFNDIILLEEKIVEHNIKTYHILTINDDYEKIDKEITNANDSLVELGSIYTDFHSKTDELNNLRQILYEKVILIQS
jgi:hypothetical protein